MPKSRLLKLRSRRSLRANFERLARRWRVPFRAQVPMVVVIVGLTAATLITWLGIAQLREQSDAASSLRARVLSVALAERLRAAGSNDRAQIIDRAEQRSGAEILLVRHDGTLVIDGSLGPPSKVGIEQLLIVGDGETTTRNGRSRFHSTSLGPPLEHLALLVFVAAPTHPFGESSLLRLTAVFALILTAIAAVAAFGLARSVYTDVKYVKDRIEEMATSCDDPAGEMVPVRTADAVGSMTNAFNGMVERFAAAEHAYRRDLEGALVSERERSEFLAALSHELRTPLNVILGFTDVLLSEIDGPLSEDARENMTIVRRSGEHLQRLISDVLDLSALESGQLQLQKKLTDVYAVAQDIVRENRVAAKDKGLILELHGSSAIAWADPVRLRQIIDNLLSNAIKFTSEGRVTVEVSAEEGCARVRVTDTGPGIAPKEQARIFDEYTQVGDLKAQRAGSGLGLAIMRRLVKMHGGSIELNSALGQGSSFLVTLPAEEPQRTTLVEVSSERQPKSTGAVV